MSVLFATITPLALADENPLLSAFFADVSPNSENHLAELITTVKPDQSLRVFQTVVTGIRQHLPGPEKQRAIDRFLHLMTEALDKGRLGLSRADAVNLACSVVMVKEQLIIPAYGLDELKNFLTNCLNDREYQVRIAAVQGLLDVGARKPAIGRDIVKLLKDRILMEASATDYPDAATKDRSISTMSMLCARLSGCIDISENKVPYVDAESMNEDEYVRINQSSNEQLFELLKKPPQTLLRHTVIMKAVEKNGLRAQDIDSMLDDLRKGGCENQSIDLLLSQAPKDRVVNCLLEAINQKKGGCLFVDAIDRAVYRPGFPKGEDIPSHGLVAYKALLSLLENPDSQIKSRAIEHLTGIAEGYSNRTDEICTTFKNARDKETGSAKRATEYDKPIQHLEELLSIRNPK